MKLKEVNIRNYRQFLNSTINFEVGTTILAGANNSGKTSLIDLLRNVIDKQACNLSMDDFPVKAVKKRIDEIFNEILKLSKKKIENIEKLQGIYSLLNLTISSEKVRTADPFNGISVNLEVIYDEDEDISRFSDYLMDLEESIKSFYFRFEYGPNNEKLIKILEKSFDFILNEFSELNKFKKNSDEYRTKSTYLKKLIKNYYFESFESKYYYTDKEYTNKLLMNSNEFKKLFNLYCINANKRLNDGEVDKKHSISSEMVNYVSREPDWDSLIKKMPDNIRGMINTAKIDEAIKSKSLKGLENVIGEISKTSGGKDQNILLDFDIDNDSINAFLKSITKAKYQVEDYSLKETAQGLGYSNLILIHLKLENYLQEINNSIINIFIIEEPEAHMHPQMQKVFIEYLFNYYKVRNLQGLITTHSNEIVKASNMKKIRVIREKELFVNQIFDMNTFLKTIDQEDLELSKFYNQFFNINFSEMIFSDRIIMYEGDTERMYIQSLLKKEEFSSLNKLYIAYIQVGGAYAHKYKRIIEHLGIKTIIFTDIDYKKDKYLIHDISKSESSNAAINSFYHDDFKVDSSKKPSIQEIYQWKKEVMETKTDSQTIYLEFQDAKDGYARTLEEAMLSKLFSINCEVFLHRAEWKKNRGDKKLKFSIPRSMEEVRVKDIVESSSSTKTDFMYSVIENDLILDMLPNYIKEGLEWLMKSN